MTQRLFRARRDPRLGMGRLLMFALVGILPCGVALPQTCPSPQNRSLPCNDGKGCKQTIIVADCSGGEQPNYRCNALGSLVCCNQTVVNYGFDQQSCKGTCGSVSVGQRESPPRGGRQSPSTMASSTGRGLMAAKGVLPSREKQATAIAPRLLAAAGACWETPVGRKLRRRTADREVKK